MNGLLAVVLLFLLFSAWEGRRKGFIKKAVELVSWILTFAVTSAAVPYCSEILKEKTGLYQMLERMIASSDAKGIHLLTMLGQQDAAASYLADWILRAAAFLMVFLLVSFLVKGISFALGIAAHLPVLHGLNKSAGMLLGFTEGILAVWIFFLAVTVCAGTETGMNLLLQIAESEILSWIYRHNLLFLLLVS